MIKNEPDTRALVWESEELACESPNHGTATGRIFGSHDEGPATHYVKMTHQCAWGVKGEAVAVCATLTEGVVEMTRDNRGVHCLSCNTLIPDAADWMVVLGPVLR